MRPAECAEVTRIRQQAQLARANAESEMGQASLALARRAASTDPVEVRNQQLENRRAAEVARRNAADHIGRARQLDGEASLKAAQLRAAGVECGRR
ncbi:MAG TPA: hypothetical protein VF215_14280 [Thermoanaerobaculia bacterium]